MKIYVKISAKISTLSMVVMLISVVLFCASLSISDATSSIELNFLSLLLFIAMILECLKHFIHSFFMKKRQFLRNQHYTRQNIRKLSSGFSQTKETSNFNYNPYLMSVEWNRHLLRTSRQFFFLFSYLRVWVDEKIG